MSTFEELNQTKTPQKHSFSQKIKYFWLKYGEKVILVIGIALIALVSFEAGFLKGQKNRKKPVEVNQAACAPCPNKLANGNELKTNVGTNNSPNATENKNSSATADENPARIASQSDAGGQKCALVASKNSNKYHLATCQWAQKIKPENKICFSSAEEAASRGYQGAKCCIK